MRTYSSALKTITIVTLTFFVWTFGPLFQVAAWATEKKQGQGQLVQQMRNAPDGTVRGQAPFGMRNEKQQEKNPASGVGHQASGERFEKALEDIREKSAKAHHKHSRGEDAKHELDAIRVKKAEIESVDADLQKEFAATEQKLKDANLPREILDRHHKFVKHYQENVKELKTNLNDVEKAKTSKDRTAKMQKMQEHLEKVKAPKRHKQLDPNNLPHRMVKAKKEKAPRLKKEEFEKDFPKQKQKRFATNERELARINNSAWNHNPILLAYNGDISDLQLNLPRPSGERTEVRGGFNSILEHLNRGVNDFVIPYAAFRTPHSEATPLLLAQAITNPPTAEDLAQTPEIQFTPEIQALAAQLDHNPVKIYNWVRNNIEYAPTYGSIQGADQCLQSKICNDMDTASLLIALLRTSGIYAHYVYGTIELPIEKAMNWVGGVTDPKMAGTIIATNGIPGKSLISGGAIKAMQLEHVWVNAYIDYIPSRGAVQRQGNTWIPLDASYKQYTYTSAITRLILLIHLG